MLARRGRRASWRAARPSGCGGGAWSCATASRGRKTAGARGTSRRIHRERRMRFRTENKKHADGWGSNYVMSSGAGSRAPRCASAAPFQKCALSFWTKRSRMPEVCVKKVSCVCDVAQPRRRVALCGHVRRRRGADGDAGVLARALGQGRAPSARAPLRALRSRRRALRREARPPRRT